MLESNANEKNWVNLRQTCTCCVGESDTNTVKPCATDTHLKQTPVDNGQFHNFVSTNSSLFSPKLFCIIQIPANMDNAHFTLSWVTNSYILSTSLFYALSMTDMTEYLSCENLTRITISDLPKDLPLLSPLTN